MSQFYFSYEICCNLITLSEPYETKINNVENTFALS